MRTSVNCNIAFKCSFEFRINGSGNADEMILYSKNKFSYSKIQNIIQIAKVQFWDAFPFLISALHLWTKNYIVLWETYSKMSIYI